jgi:hypothetical protein
MSCGPTQICVISALSSGFNASMSLDFKPYMSFRWMTDRSSMAGTTPTGFEFTRRAVQGAFVGEWSFFCDRPSVEGREGVGPSAFASWL